MKTVIHLNQINAMTGCGYIFDLDFARGFFSHEAIGNLDAPEWSPTGSTIENVIDEYSVAGTLISASRNIIGSVIKVR